MGRTKGSTNKPKTNSNEGKVVEIKKDEVVEIAEEVEVAPEISEVVEPTEPQKELSTLEKLQILTSMNELITFNGIEFTMKKYLPMAEKLTVIELVLQNCFDGDSVDTFAPFNRELMLGYALIKYYTDIEISDVDDNGNEISVFDLYDLVKDSGLLDYLKGKIPYAELEFLNKEIDNAIKAKFGIYDNKKGIVEVVGDFLGKMSDDIPQGIEELKNFDPSKLGNIMDILGKFDKFNNPSKGKGSKGNGNSKAIKAVKGSSKPGKPNLM